MQIPISLKLAKIGLYTLSVFTLAFSLFISPIFTNETNAATSWKAGRIIDDAIFTKKSAMSASQIQSFLNAKVPTCDTSGQQLSEYGGPDLNNDGRVQRWEWGKANYNQTTFPCIKNYSQGGKSAATIIYETSQEFSINPQVLIVLLQKEQALITDTWPLSLQYRSATGYGCPDTAACDSEYYGFTNQVRWAARMFRSIMNESPSWYTPYTVGSNYIQYNPVSSCGGSNVNIENRATQALYNYTPYQPNQAALAAGWGTAACGAYGNRNFFLYFNSWFGTTVGSAVYSSSLISAKFFSDANLQNEITVLPPNSNVYTSISVRNTGNQTWYEGNVIRLGTNSPKDRSSIFHNGSWINERRPAKMLESSVESGDTASFIFSLKTPNNLGTYNESFAVVMEGIRWISGDLTLPIIVDTQSTHYAAESTGLKAYSDVELSNQLNTNNLRLFSDSSIYIKVGLLNRGNASLPTGIVRLGTSNPRDRSSDFFSPLWISDRRISSLDSNISANETGYIVGVLKAPSQAGDYTEGFGIVYDGVKWLEEDKINLNIKVIDSALKGLLPGYDLKKGESITPPGGEYTLNMQYDGNLVIYNASNKAVWATGTNRKGGDSLRMQYDGNLVIYNASNKAVWATGTNRKGGDSLRMQYDGNLVIYNASNKAVWATGTNNR